MALIQAGKQFTAADVKQTAGNVATLIRDYLQTGTDFRIQLESMPEADLVTLGLSVEEINAIKGFYVGDLPGIVAAFTASVWVKQLLGTGV